MIEENTLYQNAGPPLGPSASVTVLTNQAGNLTKTFTMVEDRVHKRAAAKLVRGTFAVRSVASLSELDQLFDELRPNQAVTYGQPQQDAGIVVAQSVTNPPPGAITRTRENFTFDTDPGILMLDYDPPKDQPAVAPEMLISMLRTACPELKEVGMLWRPSSSSGVAGADVRGQRVYIMVNDSSQIPRIGKLIFERLWATGFGYFMISKSGQLLERAPVDASVWKPEGLDFAAAPVLGPGVSRTHFASQIYPGGMLDVATMVDLSQQEAGALKAAKAKMRSDMQPEVQAAKAAYIAEHIPIITAQLAALSIDADQETVGALLNHAVTQQVLMGDWILVTSSGQQVTVGEVLDNPDKWHGTRFTDPLEPEVDRRVAYLNLFSGGRPVLYSHLHHGTRYFLERAPAVIRVEAGQLPEMVDTLAKILQKYGELYQRGGTPVYVNEDGKIIPAKPQWMSVAVQRICRFERFDQKKEVWLPTGCPPDVVGGLLADAARHRMPPLTAVRNAPTMAASGRLITAPGYDKESCLLLRSEAFGSWPPIPTAPSRSVLERAMDVAWEPFSKFPYADGADAAVVLAGVLTAAVRSCLRTSPGFGFSATAPGTGKTLLAQCIGALYDGVAPAITAPIVNEEEWAKSLFSSVLGGAGTLLFDNAEHPIESASLCAVTTSPTIKGRVLGESREAEAEHRLLVLATGNGLQLVGDLNRRFLTCRLDARMEASAVSAREFDMEPLSYCLENRIKLITAALTLIQGYVHAGFPRVCDGLASMEDWNKLVRSTIVWLIQQGIAKGFVDPKVALMRDSANDPAAALLTGVMNGAKLLFGPRQGFTAKDLIDKASTMPGLTDVLEEIAGERDRVSSKKLGKWLTKHAGRIINGAFLKNAGKTRTDVTLWSVGAA